MLSRLLRLPDWKNPFLALIMGITLIAASCMLLGAVLTRYSLATVVVTVVDERRAGQGFE
ncbi:hypothetical protein GCM10023333_24430 [Ferrimonas pelagia]|uniref:Uncharacterized protein n=1 Tax=Ferrimonas pelagia TaxID=1177826 RepID=A0ABP9EYD3_9GAMM